MHLLEALQVLQVSVPGGGVEPRRLSFRALDIEQIGHVYEGLLDHQAVRAETTFLGLQGTKNKDPEVSLEELEAVLDKGETEAVDYLKKKTGRSQSALQKRLKADENLSTETEQQLRVACGNHEELYQRVRRFAQLIREDTFGYPLVIPKGSVFVTAGTDRRESGTHYTPKQLTEEIVRHTLQPLVYEGVAAGKPKEEWQLKPAKHLLQLKICDMAMGSGAFLVQVCRYLGERLVEAWEAEEQKQNQKKKKGQKWVVVTPEGKLSQSRPEECIIPEDATERLMTAKRIVAERCVYGVDKNPLAVEMAKLSLWLETLQKNKPFTFVDHALKCGDSLLGVSLEQLRYWNLEKSGKIQLDMGSDRVQQEVDEAIALRLEIEDKPVLTPQDQQEKSYLLTKANARIKELKDRCDLLIGSYLTDLNASEQQALRQRLLWVAKSETDVSDSDRELLPNWETGTPFHWELEFPEIFVGKENKGFDALVGNPPFMRGNNITGIFGIPYREYIVQWLGQGKRGSADLCVYFFLRGQQLVRNEGSFGLVATNTIAQGDTREVGLDQLVKQPTLTATKTTYEGGAIIYRAVSSRKWEGSASLEVAYVWVYQGNWKGEFILDEKPVRGITPYLSQPGQAVGNPYRLVANQNQSFQGSIVLGKGFILTPEEAQSLIKKDSKNKEVLFPYLNGQDLNSKPDQSPSRWVINFFDFPLDQEHDDPKHPKGPPYAADYPDCLAIVKERVKPEREKNKRKVRRERWWQFAERSAGLYEAIALRDRVIGVPQISKYISFSFVQTNMIYAAPMIILVLSRNSEYALLQSSIHRAWAWDKCSTMRDAGIRYSPSDCFETFPFPELTNELESIGERYYNHRQSIMETRQEGLTKTYNRFHDPKETAKDITTLRELHREMDEAVATAYGWDDLSLDHGFHETKQGLRYTISETAREDVLNRLLQLNHDRYAEEVAQGLHDKKKKKKNSSSKGKKKQKARSSDNQQRSLL